MSVVGYKMDEMYFAWLPNPIDIDINLELPQFNFVEYKLHDCSLNYTSGKIFEQLHK